MTVTHSEAALGDTLADDVLFEQVVGDGRQRALGTERVDGDVQSADDPHDVGTELATTSVDDVHPFEQGHGARHSVEQAATDGAG